MNRELTSTWVRAGTDVITTRLKTLDTAMLGRQMLKDATNPLLALLIGIIVGALCGAVILLISTHERVWNNTLREPFTKLRHSRGHARV